MLVATTIMLLLAAVTVTLGLWTKSVADAATTGKAQALAGVQSLAAEDATAAASQFAAASRAFGSAKRSLGPDWVADVAGRIPWVGRQYSVARSLVEIGLDGSSAGARLAAGLQRTSVTSSTAEPMGRLATLIIQGRADLEAALTSISDAAGRAAGLSADGLVRPLADAVRSVKDAMRGAAPFLDRSEALLELESYLLSADRRILVVSHNGAELRPTGGFIGSFGVVETGPTGVRLDRYHDVYDIPDPRDRIPQPLGQFFTNHFSFRNANWWIDFPTSAGEMLKLYRRSTQPPVVGVIAVDTVAIEDVLAVIGPVHVAGYRETFTSANVLDRLTYLVEVKGQALDSKKDVLIALATEMEARLLEASPSVAAKTAMALGKAADSKHVQMYFADPRAQAAADALGWSGRIAPPEGTTDVLAVSNAMTTGSKVNMAMQKTIGYEVTLQPDLSAETTLVLGYANTKPYPVPVGPTAFEAWLRVYRAPGAVFPTATPSGGKTRTVEEFGYPAEIRQFAARRGESRTETLTARVPDALSADAAWTMLPGGVRYRLYLVRQADLEDVPTTIAVAAPPGWRVTGASAHLIASGEQLNVMTQDDRALLSLPLRGDLEFEVRLAPN